jgi:uncharacterized protein with ATP-grasp and redox domains
MKRARIMKEQIKGLIEDAAASPQPVYFLFASAHELPYDAVLVEKLSEEGIKVVGVVRRERFEDYAVASDLDRVGISNSLDDIVEIEAAAAPSEDDGHVVARMNASPFVIVKGGLQSLYFHNNPLKTPIVAIFAANCHVLQRAFNVAPRSINALVIGKQ